MDPPFSSAASMSQNGCGQDDIDSDKALDHHLGHVDTPPLVGPRRSGFVPGQQELFHISVAGAEAEIQPDAVADDLGREAVMLVASGGWCIHTCVYLSR